jgi:tetratricopeptide (TPR) repeat protein
VQLGLPLPTVGLPQAGSDEPGAAGKIEFGSPLETKTKLTLVLPPGLTARTPVAISVKRDYAEYASQYKLTGSELTAERRMSFRMRALPAERRSDYRAFQRAVRNDEGQEVWVENANPGAPSIPADAKADDIHDTAAHALQSGNYDAAISLFLRVVEKEPRHKLAWNNLGLAYLASRKYDEAIGAFRKQIEVNPFDERAYNNLGRAFWQQRKYDEAEAAFRKQLEVNPLDRMAQSSLAHMLRENRKHAEAVEEFEKAIAMANDDPSLLVGLGQSLLQVGEADRAMEAFDRAVELAPVPPVWNNIAYELSLKKTHLDRAQEYAESAVSATSAALRNVSLSRITIRETSLVQSIAAYWDTLGWVYFQLDDLERAERFVRAAWVLGQHAEVGDHLGQIMEKMGRKTEAASLYAQALSADRPVPETRGRLAALAGGEERAEALQKSEAAALTRMRTVPLGKLLTAAATAEFLVNLNAEGRVEEVKFLRGEERLRPLAEALRTAQFPVISPDGAPLRLPRRGALSCVASSGECVFTLLLPDEVTSVN